MALGSVRVMGAGVVVMMSVEEVMCVLCICVYCVDIVMEQQLKQPTTKLVSSMFLDSF